MPPEQQKNGPDSSSHCLCHHCCWGRPLSIEALITALEMSISTIHAVFHEDLGHEKKFARWILKLLCQRPEAAVCGGLHWLCCCSPLPLSCNAGLNPHHGQDYGVLLHPSGKRQSQQLIKKGQPGLIKAKVHASWTKQMLLTFFDSKGLVYSYIILRGSTVKALFIVKCCTSLWGTRRRRGLSW